MPATSSSRRARAGTVFAALALAAAVTAPGTGFAAAPAAPGQPALREASALARDWGRCPTARPAHRALAAARRAPRVRRAAAAGRAVAAWRTVRAECRTPVPVPVAVPGV